MKKIYAVINLETGEIIGDTAFVSEHTADLARHEYEAQYTEVIRVVGVYTFGETLERDTL